MKRPFSPVVWLCTACAAGLCALPIFDPTGVYGGYAAALDADTPLIAAVFTAARDGVYPWTVPAAPEAAQSAPLYHPLTETVTDEEMRSSVGNSEPFHESLPETRPAEDAAPAFTPSVEIVAPAREDPQPATTSTDGFITVDESWFCDALFIGDSHTEGLCDYGGVKGATFYYKRGVDVWSVMKKAIVGGKETIPQALEKHRFGKIYIMLGINEIGVGTAESFAEQYGNVVSELRALQPDALIYIQSIFHTSQKKSASSAYNNDAINERNRAIAALADGEHVFFLNCNEPFDDETGALTASYTGDGVHVKAPYYTMWRDFLLRFGRAGVVAVEDPAAGTDPVPAKDPIPVPAPIPAPVPESEPVQPSETAAEPVEAPANESGAVETESPAADSGAIESAEPAAQAPAEPIAESVESTPESAESAVETPVEPPAE